MPEHRLTSFGYYVMVPTWYESACRTSYLESVARIKKDREEKKKSKLEKKTEEKKD